MIVKKEDYTKLFLQNLDQEITDSNVKSYSSLWWKNTREKNTGGLRLTDEGFDLLTSLDIETYEIGLPKDMLITSQIIIFLDKFIDCPYYLTKKSIFVTSDKKAVELSLFAGDLRKYGLAKALSRSRKDSAD